MKPRAATHRQQSGIALLMLLTVLILVGGYAFYRSANIDASSNSQDAKLTLSLAQAKEALIAYAVIDAKRPGRMPCPTISEDGISPLLSRDDCPGWTTGKADVYSGLLPWKTLDLAVPSDDFGQILNYATSRFFSGDRTAATNNNKGESVPASLNSNTPTTLRFDVPLGSPSNDIVAVIIAPRGALDTRNSDGDEYYFSGSSKSPEDNDLIIVITRQELMAAVEKRVASEIRNCLEQHAAAILENPAQTYPWPAPLSNNIYKGKAGSLFGMVPATQPGGNPDEALKQSIGDLGSAKIALESASTATAQLTAVEKIQEIAAYSRALFDRLYIVAVDLQAKAMAKSNAGDALDAFATLNKAMTATTTNTTAFNDGHAAIPTTIGTALPSLAALRESLANSGFDIFLMELETQNALLKVKIDAAALTPSAKSLNALQTQANVLKSKLFSNSVTPNPSLANLLSNGLGLAATALSNAQTAKNAPDNAALVDTALVSATVLYNANQLIKQTILSSRLNLDPDEIGYSSANTSRTLTALLQNPSQEGAMTLAESLSAANALVASIASGSSEVIAARAGALNALTEALTLVNATISNFPSIQSASAVTINQLNSLQVAMKNNGDNITLETLKNASEKLSASVQTPPTTLTSAKTLGALTSDIAYWADLTAAYAADIAQKARKNPTAIDDSENSAYTAARKLLNSLDGGTGSIELLNKFIRDPNNSDKLLAAQAALATTLSLLPPLKDKTNTLENLLEASLADATLPTKWYGNACSALKPSTGSDSWWVSNSWAEIIFYQISNRVRPAKGTLVVNGDSALKYRIVAISAGGAFRTQERKIKKVANFLEGINAAPPALPATESTRDGDATAPSETFASAPVALDFNDRLSYCDPRLGQETCK